MVYSANVAAFRRDKYQFFSQLANDSREPVDFQAIDTRARALDYSFLLKQQQAFQREFTQLFAALEKGKQEDKEAFWSYCYYCASVLEAYHRAYAQRAKEEEYKALKLKIKDYLINKEKAAEPEKAFVRSMSESLIASFRNVAQAPFHVSTIRDYVAYANLCRVYWVFCRLTLTQGLITAKEIGLIDKLDLILGTHTDVDKIISTFQAPIGIINYFSVGLFLARFIIDAGLLVKHTFFPSELEKGAESGSEINKMKRLPGVAHLDSYRTGYVLVEQSEEQSLLYYIPKQGAPILLCRSKSQLKGLLDKLQGKTGVRLSAAEVIETITAVTGHAPEKTTRLERFKHEFYKRHCNFANDLVWGTVNFLTNFNQITQIPGPIAGYITAAFLVFDVGMALYQCKLAKEEYFTKKAQYLEEIAQYSDSKRCSSMTEKQRLSHITMLNKELIELEHQWRTKEATFYFVAAAAALLMMGFTASLLVSPPILVIGCFFACTVAVAMYLSSGAYAQYKEKSLRCEQAQLTGEQKQLAIKEYESARNEFIFTMSKNTVMPMLLIGTYALCWPAAIALTAVYIGYELYHAYEQHQDKNKVKQLALNPPEDDELSLSDGHTI